MSFFGPILGLVGTLAGAGAQQNAAAMQWDTAKKQTAAENMRQALELEQGATKEVIDTRTQNTQLMNQGYEQVLNILRETFLRGQTPQ